MVMYYVWLRRVLLEYDCLVNLLCEFVCVHSSQPQKNEKALGAKESLLR